MKKLTLGLVLGMGLAVSAVPGCKKDQPAAAPAPAKKPGVGEVVEVKMGGKSFKVSIVKVVKLKLTGGTVDIGAGNALVLVAAKLDAAAEADIAVLAGVKSSVKDAAGKTYAEFDTAKLGAMPPAELMQFASANGKSLSGFTLFAVPEASVDQLTLTTGDKEFVLGKTSELVATIVPAVDPAALAAAAMGDAGALVNAAMSGDAAAMINAALGDSGAAALVNAAMSGDAGAIVAAALAEADAGVSDGGDDDDDGKTE